jgi:hypothetical protein
MVVGAYGGVARHEKEKRTGIPHVPIFRESSRQILVAVAGWGSFVAAAVFSNFILFCMAIAIAYFGQIWIWMTPHHPADSPSVDAKQANQSDPLA